MQQAKRLKQVNPSASMAISTKANAMKEKGADLCILSAGEPDFDTPVHIKEAAKRALDEGRTKYSPPAGLPKFREAIARKLRQENNLNYQAENIIVTNGGKQSLFNLILALIDVGDEVIIPSPYWISYPEIVKLANGTPVLVSTLAENSYKITPKQLKEAITAKTKLFILNSPGNPTGSVYTPAEIRSLAEVILEHELFVVSDEIYEKILYNEAEHLSVGSVNQEILQRTAVSGGFSKSYAMTGWRLGYIAAPVEIIQNMVTIQGHSTSGVCTFAQYGGIAALENPQDCISNMLQAFAERRKYVLETLEAIPGLSYIKPNGAFYVLIDIRNINLTSIEFSNALLSDQKVVVVPGAAYGVDHCVRISYATDINLLREGLERLDKFIKMQD